MNTLPVSANDFIGAIAKTTQRLGADSAGMSYLKLSKGGFFIYGIDDTEVEEDSLWAVNPNSLAVGYVAWPINGTGKPLGEEMRGITDDPIIESQLSDCGPNASWTQQVAMQLMCVSGEDVGTEVVFKTSSKGGIKGFNTFLNEVMEHFKKDPATTLVVPVLDLLVDSYKHDKYGKIFTPVFTIKNWVTIDSMPDDAAGEEEAPEVKDEPVKKPRKKAEAKAEEKPTRRRRRKAA